MGNLIFAVIVSLFLGAVGFVLGSLKKGTKDYESFSFKPSARGFLLGLLAFVLLFGIWAGLSSMTQVERGQVGVVTRFGAVTGRIFQPGLNWKTPFIESTVTYPTHILTYEASDNPDTSHADYRDYSVDTVTRNGQRITINYTVRFRLDASRMDWIAQNMGTDVEIVERIVKTDSRIWVRNIPKQFSAEDLYTGDVVEVQDMIFAQLEPLFSANGLILDEVGLRSIVFTEVYADAIESKQIALENVTTAQYVAQQEKYRAEQAVTQAQGRADSSVVEAQGYAEALRLKGLALQEFPEVLQLELIKALGPNIRVILMPTGQQLILGEGVLTEPATP